MSLNPAILIVAAKPAKPLLIYDGDCNFCKFWVLRWLRFTRGRVDSRAFQETGVKEQFPEISPERFDESVQLVETDGKVYAGAEAVARTVGYGWDNGLSLWLYKHIPGCAPVAEWAYCFVARRRLAFSLLTRLLWGREGALPGYRLTAWVFLRLMGIIYFCAFASLGTQIIGLIGHDGILPAAGL